jgi:hypothetical protein
VRQRNQPVADYLCRWGRNRGYIAKVTRRVIPDPLLSCLNGNGRWVNLWITHNCAPFENYSVFHLIASMPASLESTP